MEERIIRIGRRARSLNVDEENLHAGRIMRMKERFLELVAEDPKKLITLEFGAVRGGNMKEAFAFVETILKSSAKTTAHAWSFLASAGVYIFLACERRIGHRRALFSIHPSDQGIRRTILDAEGRVPEEVLSTLVETDQLMAGLLLARTHIPSHEISAIFSLEINDAMIPLSVAHEQGLVTNVYKR